MTVDIASLVSDNLNIWTTAVERKSGVGRGGRKGIKAYGIDSLRTLILDLAAAGKLVPGERVELQRLGPQVDLVMGQAPPGNQCNTDGLGTVFVKTGEFGERFPAVREWTTKPLKFAKSGDVLICVVGATIGKLNLAIDCAIGRSVAAIRPKKNLRTEFLYYSLMPFTLRLRRDSRGSAQGVIGKAELDSVPIRIPPLAEQQRIVAKVDELMALCDALEAESAAAMAAHQTLVEALLATLTASTDAADLATNWARLEAYFDTLFTTEASVDALKRTFLDLAVRGKLVEQNAGDEPAKTAFNRIIALKKKLISEKKIRKDKPPSVIDELDLPFPVPVGWIWCRIGEVALSTEYGTSRKAFSGQDGIAILAMGNIQNGTVNLESDKVIPRDSDEFPELLLRNGDILYNRTNSYELVGKTGIFRHQAPDYSFASYLIRIRLDERSLEPEFLNIAMNTPYFRQTQVVPRITKQTGQANVSGGAMRNMLVPFPPIAEQQRIVVKVNELMALCDELKVRLAEAGVTQKQLADITVERAAA